MKKKRFKNKKVGSTETKNSAAKNSDKLIATIPFNLMEVRYYEKNNFFIPAYKVKFYESDLHEAFWLTDGRIPKRDEETIEDILQQETTFIYGGLPIIIPLVQGLLDGDITEAIELSNQTIEYLDMRYDGVSLGFPQEKDAYVGIDVWHTNEGLKYCISGSNWFYRKDDHGMKLIIDEIALKLIFGKEIAAR